MKVLMSNISFTSVDSYVYICVCVKTQSHYSLEPEIISESPGSVTVKTPTL